MNAMFERDLLYPTDNPAHPGSVHIKVYPPRTNGNILVVVESRTPHAHHEYLETILTIMQTDVFDRIRMDIRRSGELYFQNELDDRNYLKVQFVDGKSVLSENVPLEL